ncbi:glycerol-3-phosphate dehydrogenase/oxidase [Loktanella sp. IMCC34160]|uniref:glycerol-3-phosphate dehydrogenase/oxidase n=1 Tax=Loktanella sp. IMCC34160 TaxID=2510646 RepID=UPI00101DD6D0|nr:glycerol-3-phosphate dehydrogenase/oxidase [Loktanella sp. IMCC34160]RYG93078.1 glycerol-3-phosphate dehydrogenase/oxidase [Loktanella sp. IMCC34160]
MSEVQDVDVLILGGGINGCGTFRDLCAQGIDCLLLERTDFCAGASAGSSRLMHGGLKYLETGEFRLVRESAEERNRLLSNAAHYVRPLPSVLPVRSRFGGILPSVLRFFGREAKLNDRGAIITRLGLTLYDIYGRRFRAMPAHRMLSRRGLDKAIAGMDRGIIGAGLYYEGQISHAERLGLELVLDGEALHPASRALNHVTLLGAEGDIIRYSHSGETRSVRPRIIINAAGAWIDRVNATLGINARLMGGSKGAHLVVDNPALFDALNGHMVYFGSGDGRVNLLYPFQGRVMIGSTDIRIDDPDAAHCDATEAAYLCAVVAEVFPDIPVTEDQIHYRFSGVRPLPNAASDVGAVTRDHSIAELTLPGGTPVHCLIGGKWTTFRGFAEQETDKILALLGRPRKCNTREMQIGGGKGYPRTEKARADWIDRVATHAGLDRARAAALLDRYGTRAEDMAATLSGETPLRSLPGYSDRELLWLVRHERVATLADLLRRRTLVALSGDLTPQVAAEVAALIGPPLGWTKAQTEAEIATLS